MARLKRAEILRQKKDLEAKRRKKIQENPELREEHNRKRREQYAKQAVKREMKQKQRSQRDKRKKQKYWRDFKRAPKKKQQAEKMQADADPSTSQTLSRQAVVGKKIKSKNRAKLNNKIRILEAKATNLKLKLNQTRVKLSRAMKLKAKNSNSPQSRLNLELAGQNRLKVSPKTKRKLLFGSALKDDLTSAWRRIKSRKFRRTFIQILSFKFLKKYHFMSAAKPFFPIHDFMNHRRYFGLKRRAFATVRESIRKFFEQDDVSIQTPGKKDYITRHKIQKQKRYLCHSLKYLHQKFCNESQFVVSYAVFCKLRPFWVVTRHVSERDTCLCKKCENMILIHAALRKLKIFECDLQTVIEAICCSAPTMQCYSRKCLKCQDNAIELSLHNESFRSDKITFYSWEAVKEKAENGQMYNRVVKVRKECTIFEACERFFELQPDYMAHIGRIRHQYHTLKILKNFAKAKSDTMVIHCDFSENYSCKYFREIQTCHFGGNRKQITLHTGVLYIGEEVRSFCTISPNLQHDAIAIWSHLSPVLAEYRHIKEIHFVSDSPSSQYRNKGMFHIILKKIIPSFPNLQAFSWNYLESGHGKGAADGVGGVVKRTCDRIVAANVQDV